MYEVVLSWVSLALLAYFINAFAFVVDKYLLALPIPKPFAYAFWVAALSTPVLLLVPILPSFTLSLLYTSVALLSGAAFFSGIIFLYITIKKSDVSIATTQTGVAAAIFTYLFSLAILGEATALNNTLAIITLITGMAFLGSAGKNIFWQALFAGALLALSFVLLKWTFNASGFLNGFVWTRAGFIASAFATLLSPKARKEIISSFHSAAPSSRLIFIGNKLLAGVGFLTLYWAVLLGNVAVINALLGFQFLFIFLLALLLRNRIPAVHERLEKEVLRNKLLGMTLVVVGFLAILA